MSTAFGTRQEGRESFIYSPFSSLRAQDSTPLFVRGLTNVVCSWIRRSCRVCRDGLHGVWRSEEDSGEAEDGAENLSSRVRVLLTV